MVESVWSVLSAAEFLVHGSTTNTYNTCQRGQHQVGSFMMPCLNLLLLTIMEILCTAVYKVYILGSLQSWFMNFPENHKVTLTYWWAGNGEHWEDWIFCSPFHFTLWRLQLPSPPSSNPVQVPSPHLTIHHSTDTPLLVSDTPSNTGHYNITFHFMTPGENERDSWLRLGRNCNSTHLPW